MTHRARAAAPPLRVNACMRGPVGRLAMHKAAGEQIKRAGPYLMDGHSRLDRIVRETATAPPPTSCAIATARCSR